MGPVTAVLRERLRSLLTGRRMPLWVALVAALLCLPSLAGGFALDDHGMIQLWDLAPPAWDLYDFTRFGDNAHKQELGFLGWWASPDFAIAFLRPLASLGHALDFALWPGSAAAMHAHNILLYALLCGVVALCYRRLGGAALAAGLAALLFTVDDVHAQTAGWISGRNAILAAIPAFAALWAHHRWRGEGWRPGAWIGPALLATSLLCAEAGLSCAGYIAAHALCLDRAKGWRKLLPLLPYGAVLVVWQLLYRAGGYGAHGSGVYLDVAAQPGTFLAWTIEHAWLLALAQLTLPVTSLLAPISWSWLVAALLLGLLVLALAPLLRASALARFYAIGMMLSALPFGATVPSDRVMLPLGFGASGLIAVLVVGLRDGELRGGLLRWTSRGLLLFAGVLSPLLFVPELFLASAMESQVRLIDEALPEQGTAVMVNVPTDVLMLYPEAIRYNAGRPWPEPLYQLHAGMGGLEINRCGPTCLMIKPEHGWLKTPLDRLARPLTEPFAPGEVVTLERLAVRVTTVGPEGMPQAAAFLFHQPLEQIHFVAWQDGRPQPWEPPPLDETVHLETTLVLGG